MSKMKFVIEHLEKRVWPWCLVEYNSISDIVGKENLIFTNIKRRNKSLEKFGKCYKERFFELIKKRNINTRKVCVLDPTAKEVLSSREAKNFEYFVFGGILGDYPPQKRTKKELSPTLKNCVFRNIGKKQFPTDNAVLVVKEICRGKEFSELKFKDKLEIKINEFESVELPFRYLVYEGKPFIREKLVRYLKRKRKF
ncbi:MAG: SAM-dependent methyltransferase [Candidatus Pacearchaeota archaeon]